MSQFKPTVGGYPDVLGMVLAGGAGSRLHPLTKERAKPAVYFGGKYRIIDFVLNNFINSGIFKIKVLTQFKADSLIKHLTSGWTLNRFLGQYVDPVPAQMRKGTDWYKGTADAVYQNLNLIHEESPDYVAVFGADHIYKMDIAQMLDFHRNNMAAATVAAIPKPLTQASQFGIIEVNRSGRMIGFKEKPAAPHPVPYNPNLALVSMGNYIFNTDFLIRHLEDDAHTPGSSHDFGKDIIPRIFPEHPVYVYDFSTNVIPDETPAQNYWEDVGSLDAYYEANMALRKPIPEINISNPSWPLRTAPMQTPPARFIGIRDNSGYHKGEVIDSIISGGCVISGGEVIRSVLSRGVMVDHRAVVEDSILFPGVSVGADAHIKNTIIDRGVRVEPGDRIGFDQKIDAQRFFISNEGVRVCELPPFTYTV
jgi:glucose-1-phosphate adenylyltransferase